MDDKPRFNVIFLEDVDLFLQSLQEKARDKIISNVRKATKVLDPVLFKKLEGSDIWEFRTRFGGMTYRLLAFWDETQKSMVVVTHGFTKKTQKTPLSERQKAQRIKEAYYKNKQQN